MHSMPIMRLSVYMCVSMSASVYVPALQVHAEQSKQVLSLASYSLRDKRKLHKLPQ